MVGGPEDNPGVFNINKKAKILKVCAFCGMAKILKKNNLPKPTEYDHDEICYSYDPANGAISTETLADYYGIEPPNGLDLSTTLAYELAKRAYQRKK